MCWYYNVFLQRWIELKDYRAFLALSGEDHPEVLPTNSFLASSSPVSKFITEPLSEASMHLVASSAEFESLQSGKPASLHMS